MSENELTVPAIQFEVQKNDDVIEMLDSFIAETEIEVNRANTEALPVIEQSIQADRILCKIGQIQANIDDYKKQMQLAVDFYKAKVEREERKMEFLKMGLRTYAEGTGNKTTELPNGTLRLRSSKRPTYPDLTTLLKFSHENGIQTTVDEKPNKKAILEYIKETGDAPDGFEFDEKQTFSVSPITKNEKELK